MRINRSVFLDRDGVITEDPPHYAHRIDQMVLISGSAEAIRLLNEHGFKVIVITNQSGVAKGMYREEDIIVFHNEMQRQLNEKGAHIDAFYYCPHHPDAVVPEYRLDCECRKPKSGMIMQALQDFPIDLASSYLIGDKWSDVEAGKSVGCTTVLVMSGHGRQEYAEKKGDTDYCSENLLCAVQEIILKEHV